MEEIKWNVKDQNSATKCQVVLKGGEMIEADHVICTVSLAVLKNHQHTLFNPPLPVNKIKTIQVCLF